MTFVPSLFQSGVVFAQGSTVQSNATTQAFVTYVNPKYPFSLQYPQNWLVREQTNALWFTSPADQSGNVRLSCQSVSDQNLSKLVGIQLDEIAQTFKDFKITNSSFTTLGGIAANLTNYSYGMEEHVLFSTNVVKFNAMLVSTLKDDRYCTVLYYSTPEMFDVYLPIVKKMISGLTWVV
jgi:hypothetical protein